MQLSLCKVGVCLWNSGIRVWLFWSGHARRRPIHMVEFRLAVLAVQAFWSRGQICQEVSFQMRPGPSHQVTSSLWDVSAEATDIMRQRQTILALPLNSWSIKSWAKLKVGIWLWSYGIIHYSTILTRRVIIDSAHNNSYIKTSSILQERGDLNLFKTTFPQNHSFNSFLADLSNLSSDCFSSA